MNNTNTRRQRRIRRLQCAAWTLLWNDIAVVAAASVSAIEQALAAWTGTACGPAVVPVVLVAVYACGLTVIARMVLLDLPADARRQVRRVHVGTTVLSLLLSVGFGWWQLDLVRALCG